MSLIDEEVVDEEILMNVLWIFGNMFGEDTEIRQMIIKHIPFHIKMKKIIEKNFSNKEMKKTILFCFQNLTKNLEYEETYLIKIIEDCIRLIISNYIDDKLAINDDLMIESLQSFGKIIMHGNEFMVNAFISTGVFEKCVSLIDDFEKIDQQVILSAILVIGSSFVSENTELTEVIIFLIISTFS